MTCGSLRDLPILFPWFEHFNENYLATGNILASHISGPSLQEEEYPATYILVL